MTQFRRISAFDAAEYLTADGVELQSIQFVLGSDFATNVYISADWIDFKLPEELATLTVVIYEPDSRKARTGQIILYPDKETTVLDTYTTIVTAQELMAVAEKMAASGLFDAPYVGAPQSPEAICLHITHGYHIVARIADRQALIYRSGCRNGDYAESARFAAALVDIVSEKMPSVAERIHEVVALVHGAEPSARKGDR